MGHNYMGHNYIRVPPSTHARARANKQCYALETQTPKHAENRRRHSMQPAQVQKTGTFKQQVATRACAIRPPARRSHLYSMAICAMRPPSVRAPARADVRVHRCTHAWTHTGSAANAMCTCTHAGLPCTRLRARRCSTTSTPSTPRALGPRTAATATPSTRRLRSCTAERFINKRNQSTSQIFSGPDRQPLPGNFPPPSATGHNAEPAKSRRHNFNVC